MSDSHLEAASKMAGLITELNKHLHHYHVACAPVITDEEYDALYAKLVALEKRWPGLIDPNSPTRRVGAPVSGFNKVRHRQRMLSLDNVFNYMELYEFFKDEKELVLEPKIDGLSLALSYTNGRLTSAVTRGDGSQGDDVTANARAILTVPLVLTEPVTIEIRGEVYMALSTFNELNDQLAVGGSDPMANARNAAAGTLKLRDPAEVAKRRLSFVAYQIPHEVAGIDTHEAVVDYLETLGFASPQLLQMSGSGNGLARLVALDSMEEARDIIEEASKDRRKLNCPTDGLVFKVNDLKRQRDLGESTRAPKWAVAYKFPPEEKATVLTAVTVQIGKTGKLTPVAELEPVHLSGTMVARASLMNQDEVERLGVNVGDQVVVSKSAEIIPRVVRVETKQSKGIWLMPKTCPVCKGAISKPDGFVDYFCTNQNCPERIVAWLRYATSKEALDIDGCGEVLIRELVENGVTCLSDLFGLKDLSFLKPAARGKLVTEREKAKDAPLWRKIAAMGVDGIGRTLAQDMAGRWQSLDAMFDEIDALRTMIGPVNYQHLTDYIKANTKEIDRLHELGYQFESDHQVGPLTGKSFVITGTMTTGRREDVMAHIEKAGGIVKGQVSKKINFLVVGADGGATKAEAAQKLGTICISEAQLYDMMGMPMPTGLGGLANREF